MNQSVSIRGLGSSVDAPHELEDAFGARWSARREMWSDARPLVHAVGRALITAGWWAPSSGAAVDAGQVVGVDMHPRGPAARFGAAPDAASARATDFLFALPSSAAALVGIGFGLERYQATVAMHGLSGFAAVAHAFDALRTGRVERIVAAALTAGPEDESDRSAVAWCLERGPTAPDAAEIVEASIDPGVDLGVGEPPQTAAGALLTVTEGLRAAAPGATVTWGCPDADSGQTGRITLRCASRTPQESTW